MATEYSAVLVDKLSTGLISPTLESLAFESHFLAELGGWLVIRGVLLLGASHHPKVFAKEVDNDLGEPHYVLLVK